MSGPAFLAQPNIQRLPGLLREIKQGEIQIPRFQRPFVWRDEQRVLLFESIYSGQPIGSILLWRTSKHDLACYDRLGPLVLPAGPARARIKQYLLDGHQRLTTLYVALGEGLVGDDEEETGQLEFEYGEDQGWPIYFDLESRTFRIEDRRRDPLTWLPLNILFNPVRLLEFQKKLAEQGKEKRLINLAENLASTFKDYAIPVVPIATDDLELVTTSFQRINSAGTRMDEVHMVSALTWTETFDLNERMEALREALAPVGWQRLEARMILNTCKAALDLDIYKSDVKDVTDKIRGRPEVLEEARVNITAAAELLAEQCHVLGPRILPYSYQIVLLAEAMRQCDRQPTLKQKDLLRRWFWITSFTEYFGTSMNWTRMRNALDHIRVLIDTGSPPSPPDINTVVRPRPRFDFRAARSRALALLLADKQPLNPDGTPADAYPLLAHHGAGAMVKIVPNARAADGRAADGPENRMVLDPVHVPRLRELLESGPDKARVEFLESHLVGEHAYEVLRSGDSSQFFDLRRAALRSLERHHVELCQLEYEE